MISYYHTRSRRKAITLALLFGAFGFQRFYVGRNWAGLLCCYFCGLGVPMLLGFADALRWTRMSDTEFAARYGFPHPAPRRGADYPGKLIDGALDTVWHLWKAAFLMSPLIGSMIVVIFDGQPEKALVVMVATICAIASSQAIGRRLADGVVRQWVDPIGTERAARMPAHNSILCPRRLRRYSRRGAEQYDPWAWHAQHHEEPSSIEPPAMNPATGLYMSGPGSTGLDAAGNSYGQSHTNDRAGFWSSDHWG